jgi:hypothetical protein
MTEVYRYAPKYRPPTFNLPAGWVLVERGSAAEFPLRTDLPLGRHRFGVIAYERPLSEDEKADHQLEPI